MVDVINSAKGIQQQQAGQTIKKQESGSQKQNSIFNYTGKAALNGAMSGAATGSLNGTALDVQSGTVPFSMVTELAGQTSGKPDVDLGSIGEAAVEGGIKGAVEGQEE